MTTATKGIAESLRQVQCRYHAEEEVTDFPRIDKVVRALTSEPPGRLLDVGYAKGSFADALVRQGWDCTALDVNRRHHDWIKTIQCDLNDGFPVEAASFDVVTAGEIIEHMIDESAFLQECRRVVKPGGRLIVTTPNLSFLINRLLVLFGRMPRFVYEPYHYHCHTRDTLVEMLTSHGFVVERVIASHVLYSRRLHATGRIFERLADWFPTFGAHLIAFARRRS
jgi:2-polyprenyl-3-methyl-5-hydroxy-6-metoxy-1,4-benzoquinol methylase